MTKDTNYTVDVNHIDSSLRNYHFKRVAEGKVVTLTLVNLNKSLYTAVITKNGATGHSTSPTGLPVSTLSLPKEIIVPNTVSGLSNDPQVCAACRTALSRLTDLKANIVKEMTVFAAATDTIGRLFVFNNRMMTLQKKCGLSDRDISTELDELADAAVGSHNGVTLRIDSIFRYQANTANTSYRELQRLQDEIELLVLSDTGCATQKEQDRLQQLTPRMKDMLANCSDNYAKIREYLRNDQIAQIIRLYQSFTVGNYTFSSSDTAKKKDRINFEVTLTPGTWIPCDPATRNFSLSLAVVRWKIDFSTGVFFNYGNRQFSGNYYFIDSSARIARLNKSDGRIIPAFGALMHIYRRSGTSLDWGGEIGASLNTDLTYANFYIGACLMINAENQLWNRLVFSGGLALRRVKELGAAFHQGDAVDKNLTIDQLLEDRYRTGFYIGISYNLKQH